MAGFEEKLQYCISGHSGNGSKHTFVPYGAPPKNRQERHKVLAKMVAHSQFCHSGDYTVEATRQAVLDMAKMPSSDAKFVLLFSDANLVRIPLHLPSPVSLRNLFDALSLSLSLLPISLSFSHSLSLLLFYSPPLSLNLYLELSTSRPLDLSQDVARIAPVHLFAWLCHI